MLERFAEGTERENAMQLINNSREHSVSLTLSSKAHLYRKLVCAQIGEKSAESKNNTGIGEDFIILLFRPKVIKIPESIEEKRKTPAFVRGI
jgi:hypothetical protein